MIIHEKAFQRMRPVLTVAAVLAAATAAAWAFSGSAPAFSFASLASLASPASTGSAISAAPTGESTMTGATGATGAGALSADAERALHMCLPPDGFYDRFSLQPPVKFYTPATLYEYIDGQAEGFLSYNFQALASATYARGDETLVVDLYDMDKPLLAFGLYSTFRAPSNEFVSIGRQGFKTTEGVMFWKGSFVVKVSGEMADEAEMFKAAAAAGRAAAERIDDDGKPMPLLAALPRDNKVANSEKYVLDSVLGQKFITNGVIADYRTAGASARLFVCDMGSTEAAANSYDEFVKFAQASGSVRDVAGEGRDRSFKGEVKYFGRVEVFVRGQYVAGGVDLPEESAGLLSDLARGLSIAAKGSAANIL